MPVAPLDVARAWTHLAGHGALPAPVAAQTRALLDGVVYGEHGTGRGAAVAGVRVAGKTGTAPLPDAPGRHAASFVGLVPAAEDPTTSCSSPSPAPTATPWGGSWRRRPSRSPPRCSPRPRYGGAGGAMGFGRNCTWRRWPGGRREGRGGRGSGDGGAVLARGRPARERAADRETDAKRKAAHENADRRAPRPTGRRRRIE
ncbi:MAG: penicillin-binding transpeptidase domain-containing protein [Myxococcota bacterium]